MSIDNINWLDPKAKISKYFTVKEALWLPSWNKIHVPTKTEMENIVKTAKVMDQIRELFNDSVVIHCWIRPPDYNKAIGGAPASMHLQGLAVDFHVGTTPCDNVRKFLMGHLESLGIRMEDMPGGSWVHIDLKPVPKGGVRFFKP